MGQSRRFFRRRVRLAVNLGSAGCSGLPVEGIGLDVQAPKPEPQIMRYELTDYEWAAIKPFLPNKPRGIPRVNAGACSTGSFGSSVQVRHGATCQRRTAPAPLVIIVSFGGGGLASGTRSWTRWPPIMTRARYLNCVRAPARSPYRGQQSAGYGAVARQPDMQDSRGRRYQRATSPSRPHDR